MGNGKIGQQIAQENAERFREWIAEREKACD
jgi:hypothetical protein